jgi:MbtH protein
MDDAPEDTRPHRVVVNHEEQYSIWPADRANAPGWSDAGFGGTRQECLEYIERVWTDMRPLSLRDAQYPSPSSSASIADPRSDVVPASTTSIQ